MKQRKEVRYRARGKEKQATSKEMTFILKVTNRRDCKHEHK